ncbi:MAG: hypothetical protein MZU79_02500 [Anaerotruncus sp.]|nr:hypothetical protein [Anaerotruncus sp.]
MAVKYEGFPAQTVRGPGQADQGGHGQGQGRRGQEVTYRPGGLSPTGGRPSRVRRFDNLRGLPYHAHRRRAMKKAAWCLLLLSAIFSSLAVGQAPAPAVQELDRRVRGLSRRPEGPVARGERHRD